MMVINRCDTEFVHRSYLACRNLYDRVGLCLFAEGFCLGI